MVLRSRPLRGKGCSTAPRGAAAVAAASWSSPRPGRQGPSPATAACDPARSGPAPERGQHPTPSGSPAAGREPQRERSRRRERGGRPGGWGPSPAPAARPAQLDGPLEAPAPVGHQPPGRRHRAAGPGAMAGRGRAPPGNGGPKAPGSAAPQGTQASTGTEPGRGSVPFYSPQGPVGASLLNGPALERPAPLPAGTRTLLPPSGCGKARAACAAP